MLSSSLHNTPMKELEPETLENLKNKKGIGFWEAWKIPGVLQYSLSYMCLKFANYGVMLWLPLFL